MNMNVKNSRGFLSDRRDVTFRQNTHRVNAPKSFFDLSHSHKFTTAMGWLFPAMTLEVVPNDDIKIRQELFTRVLPLLFPLMHDVRVSVHNFFVPNRILFDKWEKFITLEDDTIIAPYCQFTTNVNPHSVASCMGIPDGTNISGNQLSAFPFAGYYRIYDEFYRNVFLQDDIWPDSLIEGDNPTLVTKVITPAPLDRNWNNSYFTTALPNAQFGSEVLIPMVDPDTPAAAPIWYKDNSTNRAAGGTPNFSTAPTGYLRDSANSYVYPDLQPNAASINDLRMAHAIQSWYETLQRGGIHYTDYLKAVYGASPTDARLQRPEYIGGSAGRLEFSEVLSTSQVLDSTDTIDSVIGQYAGHGMGLMNGSSIRYSVEEHGFIHTIVNIQPRDGYFQGIHKMWYRLDPEDYLLPHFAHLGEEAILNKEVFADHTDGEDDDVFGYVPRYNRYRFEDDRVSGGFRSAYRPYHLARFFTNRPALNFQFIETADIRTDIFAVSGFDANLLCWLISDVQVYRTLPKYVTPGVR